MKSNAEVAMTQKNSTQIKSVRFPDFKTFRFYGYTFELPIDAQFIEMEIVDKRHVVHLVSGEFRRQKLVLRKCFPCKRLLAETGFYKCHSICKDCHKFNVKKWNKKNPDLVKKYAKKYNKKYRYQKKLLAAGVQ